MVGIMVKFSFQMRREVSLSGTFFGLKSPAEIMLKLKRYNSESSDHQILLNIVQCPVLVFGAASSFYSNTERFDLKRRSGGWQKNRKGESVQRKTVMNLIILLLVLIPTARLCLKCNITLEKNFEESRALHV